MKTILAIGKMEKALAKADALGDCSDFDDLIQKCHLQSHGMGWWKDIETGKSERSVGDIYALIHSEISEAFEGVRKDKMDDHLPDLKNEEVELADAIIRIFDYSYARGFDLRNTIIRKLAYNRNRPDHKLENRMKEGGKKI